MELIGQLGVACYVKSPLGRMKFLAEETNCSWQFCHDVDASPCVTGHPHQPSQAGRSNSNRGGFVLAGVEAEYGQKYVRMVCFQDGDFHCTF